MKLLNIKNLTINNGNLKLFNDVNFSIDKNEIKSIKCSSDISSKLINLILNITSFSFGEISLLETSNLNITKKTLSKDTEKIVPPSKNDDISMNISLKFNKVPAKVEDKIILFNPTDIIYCESRDRSSVLHTVEGEFQCSLTLAQLEQKLFPIYLNC